MEPYQNELRNFTQPVAELGVSSFDEHDSLLHSRILCLKDAYKNSSFITHPSDIDATLSDDPANLPILYQETKVDSSVALSSLGLHSVIQMGTGVHLVSSHSRNVVAVVAVSSL